MSSIKDMEKVEETENNVSESDILFYLVEQASRKQIVANGTHLYVPEIGGFVKLQASINQKMIPVPDELFNLYNKAAILAQYYHRNQKDKAGKDYFTHPCRVSKDVECNNFTVKETMYAMIAALLHDTIEDTQLSREDLLDDGFPEDLVNIVVLLTRTEDVEYYDYILNISQNKIAREVKLADLRDNMDLGRLLNVREKDVQRMEKYKISYKTLIAARKE